MKMNTTQNYKPSRTVLEELNAYFMVGGSHPDEFVIVGMPKENDDGHFSSGGCTVLNNGVGTTVYEVTILTGYFNDTGEFIKTARYKEAVCHEVLDAYHNGAEIYINEEREVIGK